MYPLTHAWFARGIAARISHELLLGAIFPDTVIASSMDWSTTHEPGRDRLRSLVAAGGPMADFAIGWASHCTAPRGLDYYGDVCYPGTERGFCFEIARPFSDRAATICGLSGDLGWWKAHNFVEMAIESLVPSWWPAAGQSCLDAIQSCEANSGPLADVANVLACSAEELYNGFLAMPTYLEFLDVTPVGLARSFAVQTRAKHGPVSVDVDAAADLVSECTKAIEADLAEFMTFCTKHVASMLGSLELP